VSGRGRSAGRGTLAVLLAASLRGSVASGERLPGLYWEQPPETAAALRAAGIDRLRVPEERVAEWRQRGFDASALAPHERRERVSLEAPRITARGDRASATRRPWIDANGWRYLREPGARYFETAPAGAALLAAVEGFAYDADVVLAIDPADLDALGRALGFLRSLPERALPGVADFAVVDDGSFAAGELLNLLARRNLLFRPVRSAKQGLPLTVELGSKAWPKSEAANPDALALRVRTTLGDERRSLRVYGSEVVLARLTGDAERLRLHLLNYGGRQIEGLRVRLRGEWTVKEARALDQGTVAVEAPLVEEGATEFSLRELGPYAAVDLSRRGQVLN
jgi:hypothetical protein